MALLTALQLGFFLTIGAEPVLTCSVAGAWGSSSLCLRILPPALFLVG